jgi:hypothetical protein
MPLKSVQVKGKSYKLGRVAKPRPASDFSRRSLFGSLVPAPPASIPNPASDADQLSKVFLNDQLGDCVIADGYHYLGGITSGAGKPFLATDTQVQTDYANACGYEPGNPFSDRGCDIPTVLDYYTSTGFADGSKLLGSIDIDATNQLAVKQAIWITGGVCFGVGLPDSWINSAPQESGFVWDVAGPADQMNGHCFEGFGYNDQGVLIATWGMWGVVTWAAVAKYASAPEGGELHARVNPVMINPATGLAPNGFNLNQICTYFNAMGGNVVVPPAPGPGPAPSPTPTPTPTPPAPVSVSVPFGIYNLTISGTPNGPAPALPPDPVTITWNGQVLVLSATMANKN